MARFGVRMWRNQPRRLDRRPNKIKTDPRRKPLGPPLQFSSPVVPFSQLPTHLQALSGKDRAAGERDD